MFPIPAPSPGRYGPRTWSLWGATIHWAQCKGALASIARVAKDVSQRIKAEFRTAGLYLAYQVFDVGAWSYTLSDSTPGARLDASARKLCEALGMRHDRCAWVAAAKIALALKSGWVNKQGASASAPGCSATIDNRLVWRAALGSVSFPSSLAPAVRF